MAYQYRQHPGYNNAELLAMGVSSVGGKAANVVGIVPTPEVMSNRQTQNPTAVQAKSPWSQGFQGQLVAGAAVLGLIWFLSE